MMKHGIVPPSITLHRKQTEKGSKTFMKPEIMKLLEDNIGTTLYNICLQRLSE